MIVALIALLATGTSRTVTNPTDNITPADCGNAIVYSAPTVIQAAAVNLPANCKITVSNTGMIYAQITVTEPGFATATFNLPKSPDPAHPKLWWLNIAQAADGSWFAALKSQ